MKMETQERASIKVYTTRVSQIKGFYHAFIYWVSQILTKSNCPPFGLS